MRRSAGPWGIALIVSLLLHAVVLGGLDWHPWWTGAVPSPQVFEARLVAEPATTMSAQRQSAARTPPPSGPVPRAERRAAVPPPVDAPDPPPDPSPVPSPEALPAVAAAPAAPEVPAVPAPPVQPAPPPLNSLPARIDMRFDLHYGLASGEQTLVWVSTGNRYTLTSVAGATGLTGMFYRGRFVQTSRGRITPLGLQPEDFWDQRGDRRSTARFDQAAAQVVLEPARGAPVQLAYADGLQDALSLFFQFALVAPPAGAMSFPVFNGKKVRTYTYEVRGEETLQTAVGPLRTLHLARVADPDGRFEAWLAIDRHYLPVRVLKGDADGRSMELTIRTLTP